MANEARRKYWEKYNRSEKRKACQLRYRKSGKEAENTRRYRRTEAGRIIAFLNDQRPERKLAHRLLEQTRRNG
jgi:hypothetical protein